MGFLGFRDGCGGMQPNRVEFEKEKMEGMTKLGGTSDDALWFVHGRRGLGHAWSARSGFCILVGVGHGVGFFLFFYFFLIWVFGSGGILVGIG